MLVRRDGGFIDLILCDTYRTCLVEAHVIDLGELPEHKWQRKLNVFNFLTERKLPKHIRPFCDHLLDLAPSLRL